jgi:hypothetical protein
MVGSGFQDLPLMAQGGWEGDGFMVFERANISLRVAMCSNPMEKMSGMIFRV